MSAIWDDHEAMLRAKRGGAPERERLCADMRRIVDGMAAYASRIGMLQQCRITREDVKQECYVFILTALQRWDETRPPLPFLTRYAYGAMRIYAYRAFPVRISGRGYYARETGTVWSVDVVQFGQFDGEEHPTIKDSIGADDDVESEALLHAQLDEALRGIPEREKRMLLRIAGGYTYSEVAKMFGVSHQTVHNIAMRHAPGLRQKRKGERRRASVV